MPEVAEGKIQIAPQVSVDVKEAIARLAKLEGVTQGEMIDIAVRAYDAEPEVLADAPALPDDASVVLLIPRDREMLTQAMSNLVHASAPHVHPNEIWKALVACRTAFQKTLPEYKAAEQMRREFDERREAAARPLAYTKKGASLS